MWDTGRNNFCHSLGISFLLTFCGRHSGLQRFILLLKHAYLPGKVSNNEHIYGRQSLRVTDVKKSTNTIVKESTNCSRPVSCNHNLLQLCNFPGVQRPSNWVAHGEQIVFFLVYLSQRYLSPTPSQGYYVAAEIIAIILSLSVILSPSRSNEW